MRRGARANNRKNKTVVDKILIYTSIAVAIISLILIGAFLYSKSLSDNVKNESMTLEQMAKVSNSTENNTASNIVEETESASTDIGKSVNEVLENTTASTNVVSNNTTNSNTTNTSASKNNTSSETSNTTQSNKETKKELSFAMPVEGEVVKGYAKDSLVYSETLGEWVTHLGIDIQAEKTTVVKSAEAGTVKSIKNDPRYGLTIVIDHGDGYQTIYANLLSSEFVVEGEEVKKGQTIGTVGNTAAFESVDEAHLHFELLKDSIQLDPTIYLK